MVLGMREYREAEKGWLEQDETVSASECDTSAQ